MVLLFGMALKRWIMERLWFKYQISNCITPVLQYSSMRQTQTRLASLCSAGNGFVPTLQYSNLLDQNWGKEWVDCRFQISNIKLHYSNTPFSLFVSWCLGGYFNVSRLNTWAENMLISVALSFQASGGRPAFWQVCSRKVSRSQPYSVATWGRSRPW